METPKFENQELGENVTIHAVFSRHGEKLLDPKNPETALTPEGEEKSRIAGKNRPKVAAIKSYTSDTARTKKTAEFMVEESPTETKMDQRLRDDIAFHYDEKGDFVKEAMRIKKEILGPDYKNLAPEEINQRLQQASNKQVDYYLSFGDQRPDPDTYSPVETASGIARMVDRYMKMSARLKSGSEVDLINATHDFNLASFLKEVIIREIDGKKVRGFESIKEIGGATEFNEAFEIIVKRQDSAERTVKLLFRGNEYDIDEDRLNELLQIAKELEEKEDASEVVE